MIRQNALVKMDFDSMPKKWADEYRSKFDGKVFIFLGEIPQAPGHCVLADLKTGYVEAMYHTDNFVELTDDEV